MTNYIDKSNVITEGLRKSFQSTECKMANRRCYGYYISLDGNLTVNQAESKIVQWIFERYLVGDSFGKIATGLKKQGILSPAGKATWNHEAISKLLSNEKYIGSVLLQKTMSIFGAQFKNNGELEQVVITDKFLRISTYCRVSSFKENQKLSLETYIQYYLDKT